MDRNRDALEVVMTWGGTPQHGELFEKARTVTVGDADDATFVLPREVVAEPFALVEPEDGGFLLCIPPGASACVVCEEAGVRTPIDIGTLPSDANGTRRVRMLTGMIADVEIGAFTFHVRTTDAKVDLPGGAAIDWRPYRWVGASLLFHSILIGIFLLQPPDAGALSIDLDGRDLSRMQYYMTAIERDEMIDDSHLTGEAGAATNEGRPQEGDEGAAGAQDERRNTGGRVSVRGDDQEARVPLTAQSVRELNTFATLAAAAAGLHTVSSAFGDPYAQGWADEDAYGPLMADAFGFGNGAGGFGMHGTGRGGCPVGATNCGRGLVGVGDLDTVGTTGGCSREDFGRFVEQYGRSGAMDRCSGTSQRVTGSTLRRNGGEGPPRITLGVAEPVGGLSREQIRRVVHRNIPQVRFCYEQGLQARPDMEGRVSVMFVIAQSGAVQSAQVVANDLGDARAGQCVADAVRRWPFPSSPGVTAVTYPFMFTRP